MKSCRCSEEDLLALSGIQHFAFCERQWGLIHIENQWVENVLTAQGRLLHKRTEDPLLKETRGGVATTRAVPLVSYSLGLFGVADVIEMKKSGKHGTGFTLVEYKRGRPKPDDRDEVQLCAQAICLEEMRGITLTEGFLYYGETKRRQRVFFDDVLRSRVHLLAQRMHELHTKGETPRAIKSSKCRNCSLADICLPVLGTVNHKVNSYLERLMNELQEETGVNP